MITEEIEKLLPLDWSQVTLQKYEDANEWLTTEPNHVRKWIGAISSLTGAPYEMCEKIPFFKLTEIIRSLEWMTKLPSEKFIKSFEVDGVKYVVNPDIQLFTASQFVKMSETLQKQEGSWRADIAALFIWKEGESFDINNHKEISGLIYNRVPFSVVFPLALFFYRLMEESRPFIEDYFQNKIQSQMKEVTKEVYQTISEMKDTLT